MFGGVAFGGAMPMSSTQTVGDSLKISEGVARSVSMPRSAADSFTITESVTRGATSQTRGVADAVGLAEAMGRSQSASRSTRTLRWVPAAFGAVAFGGASLGGAQAQGEAGDYLELVEGIVRAAGRPRAVSDTITLVESIPEVPVLGPHLPGRSNPSQPKRGISHPSQKMRGRGSA